MGQDSIPCPRSAAARHVVSPQMMWSRHGFASPATQRPVRHHSRGTRASLRGRGRECTAGCRCSGRGIGGLSERARLFDLGANLRPSAPPRSRFRPAGEFRVFRRCGRWPLLLPLPHRPPHRRQRRNSGAPLWTAAPLRKPLPKRLPASSFSPRIASASSRSVFSLHRNARTASARGAECGVMSKTPHSLAKAGRSGHFLTAFTYAPSDPR